MTRIIPVITVLCYFFYSLAPAIEPHCNPRCTPPIATSHSRCADDSIGSMVAIPGGTLQIGLEPSEITTLVKLFGIDHPDLFENSTPKHSVTLHDFSIDACLVTNAQFQHFTDGNPQWQPGHLALGLDNGNYLKHWQGSTSLAEPDHPLVNVNWYAAVAYCHSVGKRLPTEAEWEHAARGGLHSLFPWGDQFPDADRVNFADSHLGTTSPVAAYPPNNYGLFDMSGNVWQFLADEYQPYSATSQINPVAGNNLFLDDVAFLQVKTRRVIRGGSYDGAAVNLWVEYRDSHPPDGSRDFVGFRCAK